MKKTLLATLAAIVASATFGYPFIANDATEAISVKASPAAARFRQRIRSK